MKNRSIKYILEIDFPEVELHPFEVAQQIAKDEGVEFYDHFFGDGHEERWEMAGGQVIETPANVLWDVKLMVIQNPLKPHIPLSDIIPALGSAILGAIEIQKELDSDAENNSILHQ